MEILEWVRFIVGSIFLIAGLVVFLIEIYGVFHFDFVLNRMHVAAMGDTLAIGLSMVGLIIFNGLNFNSLKLAFIILFFWFASPVASHLLGRLEVSTNINLKAHCEIEDEEEKK